MIEYSSASAPRRAGWPAGIVDDSAGTKTADTKIIAFRLQTDAVETDGGRGGLGESSNTPIARTPVADAKRGSSETGGENEANAGVRV